MKKYFGERRTGIILAADLPDLDSNMRAIDRIGDNIDVIKVAGFLLYKEGVRAVRRLVDAFGKPVFCDLKIADVPHMNTKIIELIRENGASAAMLHGFVGPDGIQDAIDAAGGELGIIIQLELTNPGGVLFTAPIAEDMAELAAGMDVYGFQAPGNRPDRIARIRQIAGPDRVLVCCGVGAQGGNYHDVMAAGGTYAIIGRSIYQADDPAEAARRIVRRPEAA